MVEDLEKALLGREPAERLKLISRLDSLSSNDYKTEITEKHPYLLIGLSVMKDSYSITLKEDAKPFRVTACSKESAPTALSEDKRRVVQNA